MYIDDEIDYPKNVPQNLMDIFYRLQEYYDKDMWAEYELLWEEAESWIKTYYLDGVFTRSEAVQIMHKHGIMI